MYVDDGSPFLQGHVEKEAVAHDAGVVNDAVDWAVVIEPGRQNMVRRGPFRDAVYARDGFAARRPDLGDHLLSNRFPGLRMTARVVGDHFPAAGGECERKTAPDTGARAGDDDDFVWSHGWHTGVENNDIVI